MGLKEKRRHPRIDARIEVSFATPNAYVKEYSKNISKGGIFVQTKGLPDANALVQLRLRFPEAKDEVSILAKVARMITMTDPDNEGEQLYGVGFYFVEWNPQAKDTFDKFYNQFTQETGEQEGDS